MAALMVLRILDSLYFLGIACMFLYTISEFIFSKKHVGKRGKKALSNMLLSFVWPISLLTKNGRKKIKQTLKEFF